MKHFFFTFLARPKKYISEEYQIKDDISYILNNNGYKIEGIENFTMFEENPDISTTEVVKAWDKHYKEMSDNWNNSKSNVGDMIVNLYSQDWNFDLKDVSIKKVFISDKEKVLNFVKKEFPEGKGWLMEIEKAIFNDKCFIALKDKEIIGFACYDCTAKGYFGPFGIKEEFRGRKYGKLLLYYILKQMKADNYGYAIIGWVDNTACNFYKKVANATYIPHSRPEETLYSRKIMF